MKRIGGLQPTPSDERDFVLGAIAKLPALDTLPQKLLIPYTVKDQLDTDFCSAFMSCAMSEPQEGCVLDPAYSFAASKSLSGDVEAWGQDIRTALKAHTKIGALPQSLSEEPLTKANASKLRSFSNWKVDAQQVAKHRKQSFFKVTGQYDAFDNARASLAKFNSPIGTGVNFGWSLKRKVLDVIPSDGYGHAMTVVGYTQQDNTDYLLLLNSYGYSAGENGVHLITREVYNYFADRYGQYMFVDMPRDQVEYYLDNGITVDDNWIVSLTKAHLSLVTKQPMKVSPALAGFLKGLFLTVVIAIAGFFSDAANLEGIVQPALVALIASVASAIESSMKAKANGEKGLFGAVAIEK